MGGTYALLVAVPNETSIAVGAFGDISVPAGNYAYIGSALGTGGFSRVDRHQRVAAGDHDVRHWHIDYLLGSPVTSYEGTVAIPERDCECALTRELGSGPVAGFGASDCGCRSHLARRDSVAAMRRAVAGAVSAIDLRPAD
jgi:endonuclease-3